MKVAVLTPLPFTDTGWDVVTEAVTDEAPEISATLAEWICGARRNNDWEERG